MWRLLLLRGGGGGVRTASMSQGLLRMLAPNQSRGPAHALLRTHEIETELDSCTQLAAAHSSTHLAAATARHVHSPPACSQTRRRARPRSIACITLSHALPHDKGEKDMGEKMQRKGETERDHTDVLLVPARHGDA